MIIELTVASRSSALVTLVREFAAGLDCEVDVREPGDAEVHAKLPEEAGADLLLHLLSYVALSAVKLGLEASEPKYRVRFRESKAPAALTLAFTVSAVDLGGTSAESIQNSR